MVGGWRSAGERIVSPITPTAGSSSRTCCPVPGWPTCPATLTPRPGRGAVFVGWLPDGRLVSVGSDGTVRVWGSDGSGPVTLEGPAGACSTSALSADGELLVTDGRGGDVLLW